MFKDVAGQEEAKESMQEIVSFLKTLDKYKEAGAVALVAALLVALQVLVRPSLLRQGW